jgi:hypothetical protein
VWRVHQDGVEGVHGGALGTRWTRIEDGELDSVEIPN